MRLIQTQPVGKSKTATGLDPIVNGHGVLDSRHPASIHRLPTSLVAEVTSPPGAAMHL